ncbi:L-idonate 5-dehydrogenase [Paraburkholderia guartelaensis]|uniref:L-idonate 5-dehydrogenase n=1 Tax=Paraburkholderia guartelaensis TaxID=2546446 RepID=UPI002AB658EC|nr:L-idonate 5-dehydrogenase [Paraburkholderia guartelaensis]
MLAAICYGKKDLRIEEVVDKPLAPNEVRVQVAYGGICGSDMHYFHRGAVGDFAIREPLTLGHEISGWVSEVGSEAGHLRPGMKAALDPSRPCLVCERCRSGENHLCMNMFFLGSAGRFPHVQGGFSQSLVLRADQIVPVPDDTDLLSLSVAEPLSVGLHAVNRAGNLFGKRVIVTGSGPIGLLTVMSAVKAGAAEVVATDIEDAALAVAREKMGAARTVNVRTDADGLTPFEANGGYFDVGFEASGSAAALNSLFRIIRRGGVVVQVGMLPPGEVAIPVNVLQSREINLLGSFRANKEFRQAVDLIVSRAVDVSPILSGTYALQDAVSAFERAGDRSKVVKLHLAISEQTP